MWRLSGCLSTKTRSSNAAYDAAAITYGHSSGYFAAGYFAVVIGVLRNGALLKEAMTLAERNIAQERDAAEVRKAVQAARALAARGVPSPQELESLGGAWVGEEALAISLCCALVARDFTHGVRLALDMVNITEGRTRSDEIFEDYPGW